MSDVHIATALCSLVSLLSLKVCVISICIMFANSMFNLAPHETLNDDGFRKFRRQLLHSSLAKILESLKPGMTTPEVVRFPDGHFRRVVYGLGPYIADYPEQALLACIVQGWCPRYVTLLLLTTCIADNLPFRCTAPSNDLDSGHHVRRSQAHNELLVELFDFPILWDEYGLVGTIVVCSSVLYLMLYVHFRKFFIAIHYCFPPGRY
jgi:Plavaka transposase